jgi:hypothetical protein
MMDCLLLLLLGCWCSIFYRTIDWIRTLEGFLASALCLMIRGAHAPYSRSIEFPTVVVVAGAVVLWDKLIITASLSARPAHVCAFSPIVSACTALTIYKGSWRGGATSPSGNPSLLEPFFRTPVKSLQFSITAIVAAARSMLMRHRRTSSISRPLFPCLILSRTPSTSSTSCCYVEGHCLLLCSG